MKSVGIIIYYLTPQIKGNHRDIFQIYPWVYFKYIPGYLWLPWQWDIVRYIPLPLNTSNDKKIEFKKK